MTPLTQSDLQDVLRLVKRLEGTFDDFDTVAEEELNITTNTMLCQYFDTKLALCSDCGYWTPTVELDKKERCFSCSPV
jgi:hypothetical protein